MNEKVKIELQGHSYNTHTLLFLKVEMKEAYLHVFSVHHCYTKEKGSKYISITRLANIVMFLQKNPKNGQK